MDVKYIGSIGVKMSMRALAHKNRSDVARESIYRLCEANNINEKIRLPDIRMSDLLDDEPNLEYAGTKVQLYVTSTHLKLISNDTNDIIMQHDMPNVSFASSGDEDTQDFVGYVAKDGNLNRACFVLQCCYSSSASSVLETIAYQFQIRSQQILYNKNPSNNASPNNTLTSETFIISNKNQLASLKNEPWFHGSYVSREDSEVRLKKDGDFLVRESMLEPGNFVLSVMSGGKKLHILLDSVFTKTKTFKDIGDLVRYHHHEQTPIVTKDMVIRLSNGVRSKG